MKNIFAICAVSLALATAPVHARGTDPSEASGNLWGLPLALSMIAPPVLLSGGALFTVKAVEASANGTVWVLESASDGARASIEVSGKAAGAASNFVGKGVTASALGAGTVLSAAGLVIAFIPNELGKALMFHEPVRR
jgi:hypothetical protein